MFFENLGLLIEAWKATESWTIGKVVMGAVAFTWAAGTACFILWCLGIVLKKIFHKTFGF